MSTQRDIERQQMAIEIADLIENRVNGRADLGEVLELVKREIWRRSDAKAAQQRADKIAAFKAQHGVLGWPEFAAKYGLHDAERRAASYTLPQRHYERGISYFLDQPPTDKQRATIAQETTMSANQAASYLGISRDRFDKLKKRHGLQHVSAIRAGRTASGFTKGAYLYSKADIDRLLRE